MNKFLPKEFKEYFYDGRIMITGTQLIPMGFIRVKKHKKWRREWKGAIDGKIIHLHKRIIDKGYDWHIDNH